MGPSGADCGGVEDELGADPEADEGVGDGIDDLIIGAPGGGGTGESYVVFGRVIGNPKCAGDADGDGVVNFGDITSAVANWLKNYAATPTGTGPGDADGSGVVDFGDITSVVANWLFVCP